MWQVYGYLYHQNRLGHMLKPPNESCETLVFLELVPSQGRKSKNSSVNNFKKLLHISIRTFPKFVTGYLASTSTTFSPLETKSSDHFKDLHKPRLLTKEVASKCLWPMEPPIWANLFLTWHRDYLRPLISTDFIFWHHDAL